MKASSVYGSNIFRADRVQLCRYFETLRDVAAHNRSSTVFLPSGPLCECRDVKLECSGEPQSKPGLGQYRGLNKYSSNPPPFYKFSLQWKLSEGWSQPNMGGSAAGLLASSMVLGKPHVASQEHPGRTYLPTPPNDCFSQLFQSIPQEVGVQSSRWII